MAETSFRHQPKFHKMAPRLRPQGGIRKKREQNNELSPVRRMVGSPVYSCTRTIRSKGFTFRRMALRQHYLRALNLEAAQFPNLCPSGSFVPHSAVESRNALFPFSADKPHKVLRRRPLKYSATL